MNEPFPDDQSIENLTPEEQDEIRSQWLNRYFRENPQDLALRERLLPKTGGLSFANVVHTEDIGAPSSLDRLTILELIYQHLQAIGFNQTADILADESSHKFQKKNQPWERTDLHLLTSLAVGPRDDAWTLTPDPSFVPVMEYIDEDFFSSPYEEDYNTIWDEILSNTLKATPIDPSKPTNFDNLKFGSLKAIVYFAVTSSCHDRSRQNLFLTLHSMTTSDHFLRHLISLYNGRTSNGSPVPETDDANHTKLSTVRLSVLNFLSKWIRYLGLYIGKSTLKRVSQFLTRLSQDPVTPPPIATVSRSLLKLLPSLAFGQQVGVISEIYNPIIPNPAVIFSPGLTIMDPEPAETARQITLVAHEVFKAIPPLELFALLEQGSSLKTPTVREFMRVSEKMALLIAETIVRRKFVKVQKRKMGHTILEISRELLAIGSYDTLGALVSILKKQEFIKALDFKQEEFEELSKLLKASGEDETNTIQHPSVYEETISNRTKRREATVPNLRAAMVNVDRKLVVQKDFVDGMINMEKRQAIGKWMNEIYELQNTSYHFCPIPQIQRVLKVEPKMTLTDICSVLTKKSRK